MKILHICSYYIGNKLYKNLIKELAKEGLDQHIFIPLKDDNYVGKNQLSSDYNNIKYYYKKILNKYDRFFYSNKINKQKKEIEREILLNTKIDFIHAHTVFSDGGTAYKLYKKYKINYAVNVRNTDINYFYKYALHLRPFMHKVLLNSGYVVFISYAYKEQLLSALPKSIVSKIKDKCVVIPNGIDNFWHENSLLEYRKKKFNKKISFLFIGLINKNKNLETVIKTCAHLRSLGFEPELNVLGNGPLEDQCKQLCVKLNINKYVFFHGYVSDRKIIMEYIDNSDIFIMPSFTETFGLVYIESMSRGIPVIYSRGQAIDGFYKDGEVGYSVEPNNISMMVDVVQKIMNNYVEISTNCIDNAKLFLWKDIARNYLECYKNNTSKNN
ncbi:glycosyltransferase family 4 protein [Bacillus solitudinis]|uniref:glycosyltransferase family 4 protein n=1 Tax=Bacillus solitudinis TaxID=2014074 RepID=UPI000C2451FC|nr:glycosyltransferase family 4 protein [Bacillus solitudinis]